MSPRVGLQAKERGSGCQRGWRQRRQRLGAGSADFQDGAQDDGQPLQVGRAREPLLPRAFRRNTALLHLAPRGPFQTSDLHRLEGKNSVLSEATKCPVTRAVIREKDAQVLAHTPCFSKHRISPPFALHAIPALRLCSALSPAPAAASSFVSHSYTAHPLKSGTEGTDL